MVEEYDTEKQRNELRNSSVQQPRVSRYIVPRYWIRYDIAAVAGALIEAKTASGILIGLPYLSQWIEQAREEQLRLEAAGTTQIEGAIFTDHEQDEAHSCDPDSSDELTRSQRQLRAAANTNRWLRTLTAKRPIDADLIAQIHARIVHKCDDDRCDPGVLRPHGVERVFGRPRCRGAAGGSELTVAFDGLVSAMGSQFQPHDRIVQAIAAHYHLGAMHPFGDGNGRTARALEAFMLRTAGVNDMVMISLSNYYYANNDEYLEALFESRESGHDLTAFLMFALRAIASRCNALAAEISIHSKRILYREFARSLFGRLLSPRKRVLTERQLHIIEGLLRSESVQARELANWAWPHYSHLKYGVRALSRDLGWLLRISAIEFAGEHFAVDLNWPQWFSETELLRRFEALPPAASSRYPTVAELSRLLGRER